MSETPFVPGPALLEPEEREMIALMIPATFKLSVAPHAPFASLRNIHANGGAWTDVTPACTCENLLLYLYGGEVYTVCGHGLQDIGRIHHVYPQTQPPPRLCKQRRNGRKGGRHA